jgi:hypothetical protein
MKRWGSYNYRAADDYEIVMCAKVRERYAIGRRQQVFVVTSDTPPMVRGNSYAVYTLWQRLNGNIVVDHGDGTMQEVFYFKFTQWLRDAFYAGALYIWIEYEVSA